MSNEKNKLLTKKRRIGIAIRCLLEGGILTEVLRHAHWSVFLTLLLMTAALEVQSITLLMQTTRLKSLAELCHEIAVILLRKPNDKTN